MRSLISALAVAALTGCGSDGGDDHRLDGDVALDWSEWPDVSTDDPADTPADTVAEPDASGPGQFRFQLPSDVAGDMGIAVRVSYPGRDHARHPEGAPVVVVAPGGLGGGTIRYEEPDPITLSTGLVVVKFILPGGFEPSHASGGTYDYRGPLCKAGLRDVIAYASGAVPDDEGAYIEDRVEHADTTNLGILALSHGGNLALTTMADHPSDLDVVRFIAFFESPIGDQYVTGELGLVDGDADNPFYEPGTCTVETCPWPGTADVLTWASSHATRIDDPWTGLIWPINGVFYLDVDGNEAVGDTEFVIAGIPGPGEMREEGHLPYLYYSTEMASILDGTLDTFFPLGKPVWMASPDAIRDFWAERDGAPVIGDVSAAMGDLLVMVLGTVVDHAQVQPDHPHLHSNLQGWLDASHVWVRLNPDAAYLALVSGESVESIPENDAHQPLPWPDAEAALVPEDLEEHVVDAALLELADRVRAGETAADLEDVLY